MQVDKLCAWDSTGPWLLEGARRLGSPTLSPRSLGAARASADMGKRLLSRRAGLQNAGGKPAALTPSNGPLTPRQKGWGGGMTFL